ncbi:MAG: hypothetical protein HXS52_01500 [Theionarchaea archaeon]|nr:hypothetical protein [Theionarchaea archaeon]
MFEGSWKMVWAYCEIALRNRLSGVRMGEDGRLTKMEELSGLIATESRFEVVKNSESPEQPEHLLIEMSRRGR